MEGAAAIGVVPEAARLGISPEEWMKGVVRIDEALVWAGAPGRARGEILDLAMQVEANFLDLHLKLERRGDLASLRRLLGRLVEEEQAHLRGLGDWVALLPGEPAPAAPERTVAWPKIPLVPPLAKGEARRSRSPGARQ